MKYLLYSLFFIVFTTSFAQELGHVIVRDKETGLLLKEVTVEFKEKKSGKVVTALSDNGIKVRCKGEHYDIDVKKLPNNVKL